MPRLQGLSVGYMNPIALVDRVRACQEKKQFFQSTISYGLLPKKSPNLYCQLFPAAK